MVIEEGARGYGLGAREEEGGKTERELTRTYTPNQRNRVFHENTSLLPTDCLKNPVSGTPC
ncbi:hypothetical protein OSCI_1050001 [Kamptonema sp. PCC 6506]|nr:hypothetical protein OSCI_1050001 [Kamptonema sp. PCC 6506]